MDEETREKYMDRLDQERDEYLSNVLQELKLDDLRYKAQEIVSFYDAYDYLRSSNAYAHELEYVMRAERPIYEIAAFDAEHMWNDRIADTVYEIYDKGLFDDPDIPKYIESGPFQFHRKLATITELRSMRPAEEPTRYRVEKVIELTPEAFDHFTANLLTDCDFIRRYNHEMWYDGEKDCWHCLLVRTTDRLEGLLVQADGYDYARYTAHILDVRGIHLDDDVQTERIGRQKGRNRVVANKTKPRER